MLIGGSGLRGEWIRAGVSVVCVCLCLRGLVVLE